MKNITVLCTCKIFELRETPDVAYDESHSLRSLRCNLLILPTTGDSSLEPQGNLVKRCIDEVCEQSHFAK